MSYVKVNDINMYYEQYGKGDSLVLIAGYSADHTVWDHVLDQLAEHFLVTVYDNRGAGLTESPEPPYMLKMLADDLLNLISALNIEKSHILGHSMGGKIAQQFAISYSEHLNKLILASAKCGLIGYPFEYLQEVNKELISEGVSEELVMRNLFAWIYGSDFMMDIAKREREFNRVMKQTLHFTANGSLGQLAAANTDLSKRLQKINACTLIASGDEDVIVLPKESQFLAKHISNSTLAMIDGCAHMPQIERPAEFVELVVDFLTKN